MVRDDSCQQIASRTKSLISNAQFTFPQPSESLLAVREYKGENTRVLMASSSHHYVDKLK
jgi:hypothetical protein